MKVNYKAPYVLKKANPNDAGWDILANEDVTFERFDVKAVKTGCHLEIIKDNESPQFGYKMLGSVLPNQAYYEIFKDFGLRVEVKGRSSMALKSKFITHDGTVDFDYHREIGVVLFYMGDTPYTIKRGDKIAQLVFSSFLPVQFLKVDEMSEGREGFGSSGR